MRDIVDSLEPLQITGEVSDEKNTITVITAQVPVAEVKMKEDTKLY